MDTGWSVSRYNHRRFGIAEVEVSLMTQKIVTDVLIVGAGLAGLMAGHVLADAGKRVVLLDKGRSVGGRMATRRIGGGLADHGAQFFTVRDPEFGKFVERWIA